MKSNGLKRFILLVIFFELTIFLIPVVCDMGSPVYEFSKKFQAPYDFFIFANCWIGILALMGCGAVAVGMFYERWKS